MLIPRLDRQKLGLRRVYVFVSVVLITVVSRSMYSNDAGSAKDAL